MERPARHELLLCASARCGWRGQKIAQGPLLEKLRAAGVGPETVRITPASCFGACSAESAGRATHVLVRPEGEVTHFITMTFWENVAAIRAFAGEDIEAAKYYPEDEGFLLEYEPRVVHYEVVGRS
jgi:hypothetical protein